jgi:7,8-dihydro-6-hydroxymethylpterin-pyrophosphokinase
VRYGSVVLDEPGLTLPHPGLPHRDFWLRELDELERHGA